MLSAQNLPGSNHSPASLVMPFIDHIINSIDQLIKISSNMYNDKISFDQPSYEANGDRIWWLWTMIMNHDQLITLWEDPGNEVFHHHCGVSIQWNL